MLFDIRNPKPMLFNDLKEWDGRERFKREGICVYLWLLQVDIWQEPSQYRKVVILQLKIK